MKKLRLFLLMLVLCLMTGCSSGKNSDDDDDDSSSGRKSKKTEQSADEDDEDDEDDDESNKKVPSAEDLINGMADQFDGADEYMNMDLTVNLDATIDASALGADSGTMAMKVSADLNMEKDKDTQHTSGTMHMEMMGMTFDERQDEYKQLNGDMWQVYEYSSDSDSWTTYSEIKDSSDDITGGMTDFKADVFEDLKVKKDGDTYVVTGTIPVDKLTDSMDMMDSLGGLAGDEDALKDCYFDVTMIFDKKSKELKSMEYVVKNMSAEGMEINDFTIGLKIREIGGDKEVTVPDDVVGAADSGFGGDTGFGGDLENQVPLNIQSTGKYDANSFMKEFAKIADLDEDDWYIYNSEYGYTSVSAGIYDYDNGWSLHVEFSIYDPANEDGVFSAEYNMESSGGEYYKDYLEQYEADGNAVKGASKDDCALWYVDGGEYDTYYIGIDGNTILKITGYVSNYSNEATEEKFNGMYNAMGTVVQTLGFPE